jgi:hypothetical protein
VKLLEENLGRTLEELGIANGFLNRILVAQQIGTRIDKWDCIKSQSLCTEKETISTMKRQPREGRKSLLLSIG